MAKKTQQRRKKKSVAHASQPPIENPDHSRQLPKLNRVEGQLAGIKKMIEELRYYPISSNKFVLLGRPSLE